jgi:NosR/NirI family transcriptional regulator, nitrous oxide reductase regulator
MGKVEFGHEKLAPAKGGPESFDAILEEAKDHVFPWDRRFAQRSRGVQAMTIGFAISVTLVWVLGILGHLRPVVVIGWWVAWSVFELIVRLNCKPWLHEGPSWQRMHRAARGIELAFYVLTKNVLIGGVLFLLMALLGETHA